jgi:hypothetical protein
MTNGILFFFFFSFSTFQVVYLGLLNANHLENTDQVAALAVAAVVDTADTGMLVVLGHKDLQQSRQSSRHRPQHYNNPGTALDLDRSGQDIAADIVDTAVLVAVHTLDPAVVLAAAASVVVGVVRLHGRRQHHEVLP